MSTNKPINTADDTNFTESADPIIPADDVDAIDDIDDTNDTEFTESFDPFSLPLETSRDAGLKQSSFTLDQYFDLVKDMPSIAKDWIPDNRALAASCQLKDTLDNHFSGIRPAEEYSLAVSWHEIKFPLDSKVHTIATHIQDVIGYRFANERLLYQAFTRRSYGKQICTHADYEVLEYLGDSVLTVTLNRLMMDQYTHFNTLSDNGNLFISEMDEGRMTKIKNRLTNKDYLSGRCIALGLDKYILFGEDDHDDTMDPKEDVIEAIIGAAALDCEYDYETLGALVETLLDLHLEFDAFDLVPDNYQDLNIWCDRRFKARPSYKLQKRARDVFADYVKGRPTAIYDCTLTMPNPENPELSLTFTSEGPTRSTARTNAADSARRYLEENGYWRNIADADIEPQLDLAVNQLQELYQKRYIDKAEYEFVRDGRVWYCTCSVGRHSFKKHGHSKPEAKKKAAFATLVYLMRASGLYDPDWYRVLDDQAPLFLDEVIAFEQEHKENPATLEEKYRFIVNMQNTYDTYLATEKFEELEDAEEYLNADGKKRSEYIQEIGIAHRNIGISLCEVMKVDYNEFYNWKRNGMGCM